MRWSPRPRPRAASPCEASPTPQPSIGQIGLTPVPATAPAPATGSGRAVPNGMICPGTHPIKGNRSSMIYHLSGGEFYDATGPEDCFASPADAEAAGYRRSQR